MIAGFVGSGPLVLLAGVALGIGPQPSFCQRLALFQFVAAVTCTGTSSRGSNPEELNM